MKRAARWFRWLLGSGAMACLVFAAVTGRLWVSSREAMRVSDAAFDEGDLILALSEARRAASAYAPGIDAVKRAHERMVAIATGCEETGDRELAVRAWRSVRSAATDVRHLWSPFEAERQLAEERLARLERTPTEPVALAFSAGAQSRGTVETRVVAARSEDPAGALGVVASLFAATLGLAWASWRGLNPGAQWSWRDGRWGLLLAGFGLACWSVLAIRT